MFQVVYKVSTLLVA